jgi:hypothetical protein
MESSMSVDKKARLRVAALVFSMTNAVLFGAGLITVLSVPSLAQHAFFWIPVVVIGSFAVAPAIAWFIAPSMMQRYLQARNPPLAAKISREMKGRAT